MSKKISRRDFLRFGALGGASVVATACAPQVIEKTIEVTKEVQVEVEKTVIVKEEVEKLITATPAPVQTFPDGTKLSMKLRAAFIPQANEILSALIKDWGARSNVQVEVDIVSMNDLQTIAATAAETGAGPDIVELNQNSAHLFAEKLADISDVCEDLGSRFGGWHEVGKQACIVDGKWLAMPRFLAAHAMNYREDTLGQVGYATPPKTWDEMLDLGKKLKDAGLPPIGLPLGHAVGDGNNFTYSLLWSFGGKEVEEDGKTVAINSPETAAALDFVRELYQVMLPDTVSWDDASNNRAFLGGEVSVTNNAASIWATARTAAPDIFAVTNHFPYPEGPKGAVLYGELMSQCVFSYTKNLDAAKALLAYLNEQAQYEPWSIAGYSFLYPLLKDYEFGALMPWNTQPKLAAFKGVAGLVHLPGYPSSAGRPASEAFAKWIVLDMFAKAATGEATPDVIAWAEEQLVSIYGA